MRTPARLRALRSDDTGAMLVFALIIVTVVAVVAGAVLTYADTNLRATVALRGQADGGATADGAAQAALNELRLNTYNNDAASPTAPRCFGAEATSGTLVLPDLVPGSTGSPPSSAIVQCSPQPGTGVDGGLVPITDSNKPGQAILTTSQNGSEQGLYVKPLSSSVPFNVHGGVVSNSTIVVDGGTLQSNTDVFAATGCSGNIVAPNVDCAAGTVADPAVAQPARYAPGITSVPALQSVPTTCSNGVVRFRPGWYNDARALSDLMSGNGPCAGSVWWFAPNDDGTTGYYYFDFQNTQKSGGMANPHQWLVKSGQLLAGTPATRGPAGAPTAPVAIPGGCVNPIDRTDAVGVQFVFGGDSQFAIDNSADAEICGSYDANKPPIAVYGLKDSGTPTTTTLTGLTATTVASQGNGYRPPSGNNLAPPVQAVDGTHDAYTPNQNGGSATLSLSPFLPAGGLPRGSLLTAAQLRIVYGASSAATSRRVTVTPTSSTGAGTAVTLDVPGGVAVQPASTTRTVDLLSSLSPGVTSNGLTSVRIDLATVFAGTATDNVDAVFLDLTYSGSTLRGQGATSVPGGNCLAVPYTSGAAGTGRCALIYSSESHSGRFYIQGTTYAPLAPIDITLSNIAEQVMRFGVISRVLHIKETGSFSYTGPVIEIPDNSPGYGIQGTVVHLTVWVCRSARTECLADLDTTAVLPGGNLGPAAGSDRWHQSLRVRAFIKDAARPTRSIVVQTWSVVR